MTKEPKKATHEVSEEEGVIVVASSCFGQESEITRPVRVRPFIKNAPVGSVCVKLGRTINMGNYEFARVDVSFTMPGYVSELVPLYHDTVAMTGDLLSQEVAKIEQALGLAPAQESGGSLDELLK